MSTISPEQRKIQKLSMFWPVSEQGQIPGTESRTVRVLAFLKTEARHNVIILFHS